MADSPGCGCVIAVVAGTISTVLGGALLYHMGYTESSPKTSGPTRPVYSAPAAVTNTPLPEARSAGNSITVAGKTFPIEGWERGVDYRASDWRYLPNSGLADSFQADGDYWFLEWGNGITPTSTVSGTRWTGPGGRQYLAVGASVFIAD